MFIKTVFAFGGILLLEMQRVTERSVFLLALSDVISLVSLKVVCGLKQDTKTPLNALAHLIIIRQQHVCTNNIIAVASS